MTQTAEKPDGFIDGIMSKVFGRSWKTTVAGLVVVACGVVSFIPGMPPVVYLICQALGPVAAGGGLVTAKDRNVSGGNAPRR